MSYYKNHNSLKKTSYKNFMQVLVIGSKPVIIIDSCNYFLRGIKICVCEELATYSYQCGYCARVQDFWENQARWGLLKKSQGLFPLFSSLPCGLITSVEYLNFELMNRMLMFAMPLLSLKTCRAFRMQSRFDPFSYRTSKCLSE